MAGEAGLGDPCFVVAVCAGGKAQGAQPSQAPQGWVDVHRVLAAKTAAKCLCLGRQDSSARSQHSSAREATWGGSDWICLRPVKRTGFGVNVGLVLGPKGPKSYVAPTPSPNKKPFKGPLTVCQHQTLQVYQKPHRRRQCRKKPCPLHPCPCRTRPDK